MNTDESKYSFPENSIAYTIQAELANAASELLGSDIAQEIIHLERPGDTSHGDFASNIAMTLTKTLKKNPREIAEILIDNFSAPEIEAEIAGPGFINFKITTDALMHNLKSVLSGECNSFDSYKELKVILEFGDPNPFKAFHIGHLYTTIFGEAVSRLHEIQGATVKRADYFGDVGMHVAKSLWGILQKFEDEKIGLEELKSKSLQERIAFLGEGYARGAAEFKDNPESHDDMKELNVLGFMAAQKNLERTQNFKPIIDYSEFRKTHNYSTEEIEELYIEGRSWSLEYFVSIFQRLGTTHDLYFPESYVAEKGLSYVHEYLKKGIFEESDGAIIFNGEKHGLHTRVFVNKLGLPTYEAKDLGLAPTKYEAFNYDKSVIMTANEINAYFQVILKALSFINPELEKKTHHIGHGFVKLPEGKMSSRTGNIITGESLIEESKKRLHEIVQNSEKIPAEKKDETTEKIAIGAVKYAFLKARIGSDIIFDFDETLSFEGNSGPYLQYTYARCKSILEKTGSETSYPTELVEMNTYENSLLRHFVHFSQILLDAVENYSPHIVCTYLFELAQKYNSFYAHCPIQDAETDNMKNLRITITIATANILSIGLGVLGIDTVEKM